MTGTQINLGCGPVFVEHPDWVNLDFVGRPPAVRQANLLKSLLLTWHRPTVRSLQ